MMLRTSIASERIEPDVGSSRKTSRGVVEQRLRQPDALQHAFAVAAQRTIGGVDEIDASQQPIDPASSDRPRSP